MITPGDPVAGPGRPRRPRRGRAERGPASAPWPGSASATCAGTTSARRPRSCPRSGSLGTATSADAGVAARAWLRDNAAVFGLTAGKVDALELVNDQKLAQSHARAVLFRQKFGYADPRDRQHGHRRRRERPDRLRLLLDHQDHRHARRGDALPAPGLAQGRRERRPRRRRGGQVGDITSAQRRPTGFTQLDVPGLRPASSRPACAPSPWPTARSARSSRPTSSTSPGGSALAYTLMVDAVSGKVLHRQNQVDNDNDGDPVQRQHHRRRLRRRCTSSRSPTTPPSRSSRSASRVPVDDDVVKLFDPERQPARLRRPRHQPRGRRPTVRASIPAGTYTAQVCPFDDPTVPRQRRPLRAVRSPGPRRAGAAPGNLALNPKWRYFTANPTPRPRSAARRSPATPIVGCWFPGAGCTLPTGALRNVPAPGPWDTIAVRRHVDADDAPATTRTPARPGPAR